ncbi:MAG: M23 family metallopeptidase [Candidatus Berkiella sp.]
MKLNTLSKAFATKGSFQLSYNLATTLLMVVLCTIGGSVWLGFRLAESKVHLEPSFLSRDCGKLNHSPDEMAQHLEVLTQHIGRIEANLMRINALGEQLVHLSGLDPAEFNFAQEVPIGGPLSSDSTKDLIHTAKALDLTIAKRLEQISALDVTLQTHIGHQELGLSGNGKSAAKGWVSSFYGHRHDPFSGRKAWHAGVDIAGKEGAEIKALAGGIVSYAATKGGYGHLVEIQHANGLCTRYGHNKEILVQPGDLVKKGQTIALLGSSGRSTGPHLHLEVHRYGEAVDPGEYFPDLRRQ